MVGCYAFGCSHQTGGTAGCSFRRFPANDTKRRLWTRLLRRADRKPGPNSRVCSCHFPLGKDNPTILVPRAPPSRSEYETALPQNTKVEKETGVPQTAVAQEEGQADDGKDLSTTEHLEVCPGVSTQTNNEMIFERSQKVILEAELEKVKSELKMLQDKQAYCRSRYSASQLSEEVLRVETGLPDRATFDAIITYLGNFQGSVIYSEGWSVQSISFEDQVFMTLMKLRQNYTNVHLAALFGCSESTVRNVVKTFIAVFHRLLFKQLMSTVPSKEKNQTSMPTSFMKFPNCKMIIDCTDIEIATPHEMNIQKETYSVYRGMHSFKLLVGVAPNAAITFCSSLFPGSTTDKDMVLKSGILKHFTKGDQILADKGFLIQDIMPPGVTVNIPPFLHHGKFTPSEVQSTKDIAQCRIHVERAIGRLKQFKILNLIPHHLRSFADDIVQVCCELVNFQRPLIKEVQAEYE